MCRFDSCKYLFLYFVYVSTRKWHLGITISELRFLQSYYNKEVKGAGLCLHYVMGSSLQLGPWKDITGTVGHGHRVQTDTERVCTGYSLFPL